MVNLLYFLPWQNPAGQYIPLTDLEWLGMGVYIKVCMQIIFIKRFIITTGQETSFKYSVIHKKYHGSFVLIVFTSMVITAMRAAKRTLKYIHLICIVTELFSSTIIISQIIPLTV